MAAKAKGDLGQTELAIVGRLFDRLYQTPVGLAKNNEATPIATTDVALSGWGAGATVSTVTGNDNGGTITVTTSVLGTPGANPTVTLTFKDGQWDSPGPVFLANQNDASTGLFGVVLSSATQTAGKITFVGTPTALTAATYVFNFTSKHTG